jgi:RNA polymerase sigma-70 factor (ECF subfamily)
MSGIKTCEEMTTEPHRGANKRDLDRFHDGDEAHFRKLVEARAGSLRRVVGSYIRDGDHAEDVIQDVWVAVFLKRHTYRGEGSLNAWINSIARNTCLMALRRQAMERRWVSAVPGPRPLVSPADACERAEVRERFGVALGSLSRRQREVVVGRLVEQKSTAETARALSCPSGTVRAALHRAKGTLRQVLSSVYDGDRRRLALRPAEEANAEVA